MSMENEKYFTHEKGKFYLHSLNEFQQGLKVNLSTINALMSVVYKVSLEEFPNIDISVFKNMMKFY